MLSSYQQEAPGWRDGMEVELIKSQVDIRPVLFGHLSLNFFFLSLAGGTCLKQGIGTPHM
jgi:hypothetical protein